MVNKGVTEVILNGKNIGVNWYGRPIFPVKNLLTVGENQLEIKYTTVLSNYCRSMKNDPTAQKWAGRFEKIHMGLEGNVRIYD